MQSVPAAVLAGDVPAQEATRPLSIFDMFRIGVGPSSSHTVGPMRAGLDFIRALGEHLGDGEEPASITVELFGSLGATGRGHWTDRAVLIGLAGYQPETVPPHIVDGIMDEILASGTLTTAHGWHVPFSAEEHMRFLPRIRRDYHVNAMTITAQTSGRPFARTYYSIGGGFVMVEDPSGHPEPLASDTTTAAHAIPAPYFFSSGEGLLRVCRTTRKSISEVVWANEIAAREPQTVSAYADAIMDAMRECIDAGCRTEGILPGGLNVSRRASQLAAKLREHAGTDSMSGMDWVNLWALAVNEENAAGHRVVTAPTNGAAGIVPAVLTYYLQCMEGATREGAHRFLFAATAVGAIIKTNASIAGAEVGCQGEVGSAAAMAAAGLAEALGGTPEQVENAAEIAMEHNLGLTCDPVGGLVQVPCIERNAVAAVKAINAARMALWGDGRHVVSLDTVIETMRQTGVDMLSKYKETSEGGLAVNVVEC
ncbi:MAG: L-serine ammonia-lyase [Flaviflexus sp.]|nr:L-serine ammonia-lyase [Flaviflexus sp.]